MTSLHEVDIQVCTNCNYCLFSFQIQINILLQFCSPSATVEIQRITWSGIS